MRKGAAALENKKLKKLKNIKKKAIKNKARHRRGRPTRGVRGRVKRTRRRGGAGGVVTLWGARGPLSSRGLRRASGTPPPRLPLPAQAYAYVSILSYAYVSVRGARSSEFARPETGIRHSPPPPRLPQPALRRLRQHTSAYVSICQHTSAQGHQAPTTSSFTTSVKRGGHSGAIKALLRWYEGSIEARLRPY